MFIYIHTLKIYSHYQNWMFSEKLYPKPQVDD